METSANHTEMVFLSQVSDYIRDLKNSNDRNTLDPCVVTKVCRDFNTTEMDLRTGINCLWPFSSFTRTYQDILITLLLALLVLGSVIARSSDSVK